MRINTINIIQVVWISLFVWSLTSNAQEEALSIEPEMTEEQEITEVESSPPTEQPISEVVTEEEVIEEAVPPAPPADEPVEQEVVSSEITEEDIPEPPPADEPVSEITPTEPTETVAPVPPTDEPIAQEGVVEETVEALPSPPVDVSEELPPLPPEDVPSEPVQEVVTEQVITEAVPPTASMAESSPEVAEEKIDEKKFGINTVDMDDPQGNWLFKRIWYEKAQAKYDKIKAAVTAIFEARTPFFTQRTEIDRNVFDPFYMAVGFGQGEMQAIIDQLIAELEEEREDEGALDQEERELLQKLREEKAILEQLQKDIQVVGTLDESVDGALKTLMGEVNKARSYEKQAWNNLKMISEELNDQKAREKFYVIDTLWRNIQNITNYIQGPFAQHFGQLSSSAQSHVDKIKTTLEALKTKGIDFKKEADRLEQKEKQVPTTEPQPEEEQEELVPPKKGWFQSTFDMVWKPIKFVVQYLVQGAQSTWDYVMSWFGDSKVEVPIDMEIDEVEGMPIPESSEIPEMQPVIQEPQVEETAVVETPEVESIPVSTNVE